MCLGKFLSHFRKKKRRKTSWFSQFIQNVCYWTEVILVHILSIPRWFYKWSEIHIALIQHFQYSRKCGEKDKKKYVSSPWGRLHYNPVLIVVKVGTITLSKFQWVWHKKKWKMLAQNRIQINTETINWNVSSQFTNLQE